MYTLRLHYVHTECELLAGGMPQQRDVVLSTLTEAMLLQSLYDRRTVTEATLIQSLYDPRTVNGGDAATVTVRPAHS